MGLSCVLTCCLACGALQAPLSDISNSVRHQNKAKEAAAKEVVNVAKPATEEVMEEVDTGNTTAEQVQKGDGGGDAGKAQKLGAQKRKAAQQKQDEEDEAGFQQRLEKDYDRCAPGEVNILEPGAKRGCRSQVNCAEVQHQPHTKESPAATEQQQLQQPDIHQWALQRAAKIEEMKKTQRENPKHWRSREDLVETDSSSEEGGGNQAAAKKEKKQAAAKSVAEEHDVAEGDDLASDVASDALSQDL